MITNCNFKVFNIKENDYRFPNGMYGIQSIFICFMSKISSEAICTEVYAILSEGGNVDTTCSFAQKKI